MHVFFHELLVVPHKEFEISLIAVLRTNINLLLNIYVLKCSIRFLILKDHICFKKLLLAPHFRKLRCLLDNCRMRNTFSLILARYRRDEFLIILPARIFWNGQPGPDKWSCHIYAISFVSWLSHSHLNNLCLSLMCLKEAILWGIICLFLSSIRSKRLKNE